VQWPCLQRGVDLRAGYSGYIELEIVYLKTVLGFVKQNEMGVSYFGAGAADMRGKRATKVPVIRIFILNELVVYIFKRKHCIV